MVSRLATVAALLSALVGCREESRSEPAPPAPAREPAASSPVSELPSDAPTAKDWNFPAVEWRSAEAGLAAMRGSKRPGLVVVMATWCPRCTEYKALFYDPKVIALSKHFEMILIDAEASPERAEKWNTDGSYFPRTFFASPDGAVDPTFVTSLKEYPHFFNGVQRGELLLAMRRAIAKYPTAS